MIQANFKRLLGSIRRYWYRKDGLIVLLERPGAAVPPDVRLVVPPSFMLPTTCLLWRGDDKLYEGAPDDVRLRMAITSTNVCFARYVKPTRLEHPEGAPRECLGCPASCVSGSKKKCRRRLRV